MSQREPDIQEELINTLARVWKEYPDLRLTQLIVNYINPSEPCPKIFYTEDSKLLKLLNTKIYF